ncbi:MAG: helix-hairpin-helix domain-containing protein [Cyclobacteriaceae bacterium]|nr:helix-hairpin-helix domain-containing protein [Cyclobacteriaceae bacterium]
MRTTLLAISILGAGVCFSQDIARKEVDLEQLVDELMAGQDEDFNYEELYENLALLLSHRADLNLVTAEQLRTLYILNEAQVQAILDYRNETGPFVSLYELQAIPQIDRQTFDRLIQFVTVPDPQSGLNRSLLIRILKERNNYLILRHDRTLERRRGYSPDASEASRYTGSPDRFYTRFRTSRPGDFSIGFTAEKDAGEKIEWAPGRKQYGPGFLSFHAQVINKHKLKNLVMGDYQAQFGQGLVLGSAFGIGKNAEAVAAIRRANIGFLPYTSAYEAGYFRGVATSYQLSRSVTLNGFFSTRWRDGSLQADSTGAWGVSSLGTTGLHRIRAEIANQNSVRESNAGIVLSFKYKRLDAGTILHHTRFSVPLQRNATPYNQFYFQGDRNTNGSIFVNYAYRNVSVFGEAAYSFAHGAAAIAGSIMSLTPALDVALLYRNFSRSYYTFYSNAVSENSLPQNEQALYWGWKYTFNKKYWISGYFDWFRFNWLRYRGYSPSEGQEWLLRFNYKPSRHVSFFAQMREERKIRNQSVESNLYSTAIGTKRNYWLNASYQATPGLSLRTRAQFSSYALTAPPTRGMALIQDITFQRRKFTLNGRYALFDTDDYDNRLYAFEKDVWLAFSFPAYYGVGVRSYVLVQYSISPAADIWLRWARTTYSNTETIGSGSETIIGNTRNDLKFQARIRL